MSVLAIALAAQIAAGAPDVSMAAEQAAPDNCTQIRADLARVRELTTNARDMAQLAVKDGSHVMGATLADAHALREYNDLATEGEAQGTTALAFMDYVTRELDYVCAIANRP